MYRSELALNVPINQIAFVQLPAFLKSLQIEPTGTSVRLYQTDQNTHLVVERKGEDPVDALVKLGEAIQAAHAKGEITTWHEEGTDRVAEIDATPSALVMSPPATVRYSLVPIPHAFLAAVILALYAFFGVMGLIQIAAALAPERR